MTENPRIWAVALALAAGAFLSAGQACSPVTMRPLMAASFDSGTKHVVSFFVPAEGQCKLTMIVADRSQEDRENIAVHAARFEVSVGGGKTAKLDTEEGRSFIFACTLDAHAMSASASDRIALYPTAGGAGE